MSFVQSRRTFLGQTLGIAAGVAVSGVPAWAQPKTGAFKISLAQWSLHKALFAKQMDNLDFAARARKEFGVDGLEYVNQFFKDKAKDTAYLGEMKKRAADHDLTNVLLMCDGEGALGDADAAKRTTAVENHYRWVEAAKFLGCHSIRVNAQSSGSWDEQRDRAAEGLRRLAEFGATHDINVIVENHGGLSSNATWLTQVMKKVAHPRCGTLPDFGNFKVSATEEYDRYKGVEELMAFAKGVSAKTHDFDAQGNETHTDFNRMMPIVFAAGFKGFIGIEYEGSKLSEPEGIIATRKLLERFQAKT
jgi:sugar phosphate isomerase/epimerase